MNIELEFVPKTHKKTNNLVYNKKADTQADKQALKAIENLAKTIERLQEKEQDDLGKKMRGRWKQYSLSYEYYGTFEVSKNGTLYEMKLVHGSEDLDLLHPVALTDVCFDGNLWSFCSDWGEHGVALFKLQRIHANRYEGYAHQEGWRGNKTIWLREGTESNDITTEE
ncbi:hypothetical protein [Candidatus Uabimicrobium sp. HlEnr_7]|uniref:hypothetical protein n=1 Tax=Candidatus Uabimicrobium helgolandensis TaxID=3095367 RepID=UPI0035574348